MKGLLTQRNIQVLRTILRYAKHYHAWPSLQELADRNGETTKQAMLLQVQRLRNHGLTTCTGMGKEAGQALTLAGYDFLKAKPVTISHKPAPRATRQSVGKYILYRKKQLQAQRVLGARLDHQIPTYE